VWLEVQLIVPTSDKDFNVTDVWCTQLIFIM